MSASFYFDWDNIEKKCDNWLFVFDRMPDKMRLIVDFRIGGMKPEQIARILKVSHQTVYNTLKKAADRFNCANEKPYCEEIGEDKG